MHTVTTSATRTSAIATIILNQSNITAYAVKLLPCNSRLHCLEVYEEWGLPDNG